MKNLMYALGAVLIVLGLIGFVNNPILGIFAVDALHNLIHIVAGILVLAFTSKGEQSTRTIAMVLGVVVGLIAILGFLVGDGKILGLVTLKILYVTSEKFTNDYVAALGQKRMDSFKAMYRNVDMLLVDDIQFIAGKEQTQEVFFHTFNELRDAGKQIILTADRLPKDIPAIEQRLVSRFEWGMVADISAPNLETRIAILQTKLGKKGVHIDKDITEFIAENIVNNIRELEGALNKLLIYQQIENKPLTLDQAKNILASIVNAKKKRLLFLKLRSLLLTFTALQWKIS